MKNNPKVIDEFDETIEIDKYIQDYIREKEEAEANDRRRKEIGGEQKEERILD